MKRYIFMLIVGLCGALVSCSEEPVGQQPNDSEAPGPVTNLTVKRSIAGGAILSYTLPDAPDLLYVKAEFERNGKLCETRASMYVDTLKIEGFGDTKLHEVRVVAVDRSRNESLVEKVDITPETPQVLHVGATLDLMPDFGGVHAYWENPARAEVSVVLLMKDNNNEYVPLETFYSSMASGEGAVRGMDTLSADFGIYVQDRWENKSETQYFTYTPIFETLFDRNRFSGVESQGDAPTGAGWVISRIWDGTKGAEQGYSSMGGTGVWPHSISMDIGVVGRISRIRLYQRLGNSKEYVFAEGNPRLFEIWGCENFNPDGDWSKWTLMASCESIKPSGFPMGENSNEDIDRATNGEDFIIPPTAPAVRYLRIKVTKTWAGGDNFQICELEVFGDNR
ncbi:hypothetical protein AGMMS49965_24470 [Bacteroidia bacterium]|nr:hypothetical protein AGMMS49965_24470 [Bacteroidia bacterium]